MVRCISVPFSAFVLNALETAPTMANLWHYWTRRLTCMGFGTV